MTCAELKALAHAYALGALEPAERDAVDAHLAEARAHEGCRDAIAAAEEAAELLSVALPIEQPPEQLWDRIELDVLRETHGRRAASQGWHAYVGGVALAAGLAAVALWLGHSAGEQSQRALDAAALAEKEAGAKVQALTRAQLDAQVALCRKNLEGAQAQLDAQQKGMLLLGRPSTQLVSLAPAGAKGQPAGGTIIFNRRDRQAVVVASALTPQIGHDYELWVIRGKEKLPAGLLKVEPKGPTLAVVDPKLLSAGVDVFAITLEPAGGSTAPRGSLVLAGAVKKG